MTDHRLALRVSNVVAEAKDALAVELRDPGGAALPPFTPGAHIELHLSNVLIRHYSLCNDWRERD
ncbi:MAG: oxidoreductase, partial [Bradyrhizobium sp.]